MTSVQQEALSKEAGSVGRAAEAPQTITMDIKQEGGQVKKEEFIFGPLLGVVRNLQSRFQLATRTV